VSAATNGAFIHGATHKFDRRQLLDSAAAIVGISTLPLSASAATPAGASSCRRTAAGTTFSLRRAWIWVNVSSLRHRNASPFDVRYMLDTNLCIRVLRDRPPGVRERFNAEADSLCISTISLSELLYSAQKSLRPLESRVAVEQFASRLDVLSFGPEAADHAADIRAALEKRGTPIGDYDALIAGHARSRGLVVVTDNQREFSRVDGLRCEDWLVRD
jgi:tRNA(fMet)-specific endonuclease VapC